MKTTKIILTLGVLMVLPLACTKESNTIKQIEEESQFEVVSVRTEMDASKVTVDTDGVPAWAMGDAVAVYQGNGFNSYTVTQNGGDWTVSVDVSTNPRSGFAIYPYNSNHYYNGSSLHIYLPDTYSFSAVSGTNAPVPMLSYNNPGEDMVFYALGALLRLTLKNVPTEATSVELSFDRNVTGLCYPGSKTPGSAYIPTPYASGSTSLISITGISSSDYFNVSDNKGSITVNIPLPVSAYPSITAVAKNSSGSTVAQKTSTITNTTNLNTRAGGLKKSMTMIEVFDYSSKITAGDGFSISSGKLYFAPGNLQLSEGGMENGTWSFLSGTDQLKTLLTLHTVSLVSSGIVTTDARDVFSWNEMGAWFDGDGFVASSGITGAKTIGNDGYSWRLPSSTEWSALVSTSNRTGTKATIGETTGAIDAKVRVDVSESAYSSYAISDGKYIPGVLIFPDGYNDQTGLITVGINETNTTRTAWASTSIVPYDAFVAMVNAGAVFLTACGYYSSSWNNVSSSCKYWSSTPYSSGTQARTFSVSDTSWQPISTGTTVSQFASVRLIRSAD